MVDTENFLVREENGLRLITPTPGGNMAGSSGWTRETVKYRSRVESALSGSTVSQGFKKFFNLGQGPDDLKVTLDDVALAAERKDAIATLKMDGSLLIRSEWHGSVMWRTRGSFGYEHLDNAYEVLIFEDRYPKLMEVGTYPHLSLLFEWTTPSNVIVLKYPEEELTLIGAVQHYSGNYLPIEDLYDIAQDLDVPLVRWYPLTARGWKELQEEVADRHDIEGYVVRINGEQDLVKVKCPSYVTKHALKSKLTTEALADLYFELGQPSYQGFLENFKSTFDEETTMWALGAISSLYDGIKVYDAIIRRMWNAAVVRRSLSRKEAALAGLQDYGQTKRFSLYMVYWEDKKPSTDLLKSVLLQNTKQVELKMFEHDTNGEDPSEREGDGGKDGPIGNVGGTDSRSSPAIPDPEGYGWGV